MVPPLALDIDGTLTTRSDQIDPRVFEVLPAWEAPIVVATGKSFPYPVALCHFLGIPGTGCRRKRRRCVCRRAGLLSG